MPEMCGIEGLKEIKSKFPFIKVIMNTSSNEREKIHRAMENGADGYLLKGEKKQGIIHAINGAMIDMKVFSSVDLSIAKRKFEISRITKLLSEREVQVADLVSKGYSNMNISQELKISDGRVKNIISAIYKKLYVGNRVEMSQKIKQIGINVNKIEGEEIHP